VIVAFESGATLSRCLAALRAQTFGDFEVLLVDNASTDGAAQAAAKADPAIRLIEAGGNIGFAAGNNLAAGQARGQWLALLNPDAYADPDWLEQLIAATQRWPKIRSFACLQKAADRPGKIDGAGDVLTLAGIPYRGAYGHDLTALPEGEVFSACGAAHLIARDLFLQLGGFDERFFCYCEDVDLGYRLRLIGEATLFVPQAVVSHVGSAVLGARSDFALYHGAKNRLWLLIKNTPWPLVPVVALLHLPVMALLLVMHALRGEARPVLHGLVAGLAGMRHGP
jgi:GT2 family glycosyltransferase